MPCTSAKSRIGCHVQGNINITQDVVRAISILPGRPCRGVSREGFRGLEHPPSLPDSLKYYLFVSNYYYLCFDDSVYKAGQTKFTVYRHKVFDFACGQAVITQISN